MWQIHITSFLIGNNDIIRMEFKQQRCTNVTLGAMCMLWTSTVSLCDFWFWLITIFYYSSPTPCLFLISISHRFPSRAFRGTLFAAPSLEKERESRRASKHGPSVTIATAVKLTMFSKYIAAETSFEARTPPS